MNLTDFEDYVPLNIVSRGKAYFEEDHILDIDEISQNHYMAEIMGSSNYTIEVRLSDEGEILTSSCDCPYDWGDYCKHQVAVLYAIREKDSHAKEKDREPLIRKKKEDIETTLSRLSKAELLNLTIQLARENPDIEKRIEFLYAPAEDEIASSKTLINTYIRQYKRGGFIAWNDVYDALEGAEMVLEKAQHKMLDGHAEEAVMLGIAVLSAVVGMLEYSDDSSGNIAPVINESIRIIQGAVQDNISSLDTKQKSHLYKVLVKEAMHKRYNGWSEFRTDLLRACFPLCNEEKIRAKFDERLNDYLNSLDITNWSDEYEHEQIKLIQLALLEYLGDKKRAIQFIYENTIYSSFREKAINNLLEDEHYSEAIRLCEEGISINEDYPGLVRKWKEYLLQAYEGLRNIPKQRELLTDFIYMNSFDSYLKLKASYPVNEWPDVKRDILHTLEVKKYPLNIYVEILKEEQLTDKLLAYCYRFPESIQSMYPDLLEAYADDVNKIYKSFIIREAAKATDRKMYKKVCKIIKAYKKIVDSTQSELLIEELKQTHKKRPAFLDELGKLK